LASSFFKIKKSPQANSISSLSNFNVLMFLGLAFGEVLGVSFVCA
jgi:hypothetical protein